MTVRMGSVIGVTALSRREGTTTIASNLARLFAVAGETTLLIDGNSHTATVSKCIHSDEEDSVGPGSRNFQVMPVDQIFERLRDPADNNFIFPARASDLFASDRMGALLEDARNHFDCIIVDLPAIETVPDVLAAAPHVDRLLIVVEWGRTPLDDLQDATNVLRRHGASFAGAVLNKVDPRWLRLLGHRQADNGYSLWRDQR